jgi:peptidoglycan/LPS O-acetylase OafA/YrhL
MESGKVHFRGLNSLRFFAALFVVIDHIPMNQDGAGLPHPSYGALFFRGAPAVSFFFTLSGFLITYLLLEERRQAGEIDVSRFYLRRVCRIWPLYFAVVFFGLLFYNVLLPRLGIPHRVEYRLPIALLLYSLLLPNLMNSLYSVGGILNPSWSIGVEEQFYLLWAPAMKRARERVPGLCWTVLATSFALFCLSHYGVFGRLAAQRFLEQLKFHFMAAGALAAWWLHRRRTSLLRLPVFTRPVVQIVLFALLADYYLFDLAGWQGIPEEVFQLLLYPWLIVNVAANPRNVVPVDNRVCNYLGTISYGIYMLHMIVVYATSAAFKAAGAGRWSLGLYCAAYYGVALGGTFLLAHLSYRYFETPFLRLKDRRFSLLAPGPPTLPTPARDARTAA